MSESTPFEQIAVGVKATGRNRHVFTEVHKRELLASKAVPVNQLAILLMVYLSIRRLEPKSTGLLSWLWRVFCYALRRWALIISVAAWIGTSSSVARIKGV